MVSCQQKVRKWNVGTSWSTQNHKKQRFSPPKTWFLSTKNRGPWWFWSQQQGVKALLGRIRLDLRLALFHKFGDDKTIKPVPAHLFRAAEAHSKYHKYQCGLWGLIILMDYDESIVLQYNDFPWFSSVLSELLNQILLSLVSAVVRKLWTRTSQFFWRE